jgi:hypothetical protein
MWTKRQSSHTSAFPDRIDLARELLQKMLDGKMVGAWVHFELINKDGWFKNLLYGKAPFLEVALSSEDCFELNLGKIKAEELSLAMPRNWKSKKEGLHIIPTSELPSLIQWIDDFFKSVASEMKEQPIAGWIEGL